MGKNIERKEQASWKSNATQPKGGFVEIEENIYPNNSVFNSPLKQKARIAKHYDGNNNECEHNAAMQIECIDEPACLNKSHCTN